MSRNITCIVRRAWMPSTHKKKSAICVSFFILFFLFDEILNYFTHNHSKSKPYISQDRGSHSLYLHLIFLNDKKGNYSCLILLGRTENKKSFFFCCKKLTNEIKTKRLWFLIYIYKKKNNGWTVEFSFGCLLYARKAN
jgi:hypothetical protein